MADVFLSYSHTDRAVARRFAEGFEHEGLSVWWDVAINPGEVFDKLTELALEDSKTVVVLWSRASVESRWVRSEATSAERDGKLIPVTIEPCKRPIQFELTHTLELSGWEGRLSDPRWQELVAAVRRTAQRSSPGGDGGKSEVAPLPNTTRMATPRSAWLIAAAIVLVAVGLGFAVTYKQNHADAPAPAAVAEAIPLAVLPFANLSPDPEQEFFCDGLTEEILNQLAQIKGLRVTGRTSSFSFKGQNEDLREIARKLGVTKLLEGSIRKDGDTVRITAQLVDGSDGGHLFSRTYDRRLDQVFTVQEEVAKDVAQALSIALDVGELSRASGGTNNLEAFDRYQRARDAFLRQGGVEGFRRAEPLLREAVTIDPAFTRAWLQLAWLVQSPRAPNRPEEETITILSEASERVMALAPDSWEAKVVRAYELVRQRQWLEAESLATATFLESPMTAASLERASIYGQMRTMSGRISDSIDMYGTAIMLEPRSLVISGDLQFLFTVAGRFEDAKEEYQRTMDLPGEHGLMDYLYLLRVLTREGSSREELLESVVRVWGSEDEVPAFMRQLAERFPDRPASRQVIRDAFASGELTAGGAFRYADALGDTEQAIELLDVLVKSGAPANRLPLWATTTSGVRAHPRFKQILEEVGLAEFYRATGEWGDFCRPAGESDFTCS